MVTDREKDSGKTPVKQGAERCVSEPSKINGSTPYDFSGKNLTPYGGLLPVITMLEKLDFQSLVEGTLTSKRIPRVLDLYRFVLGIVLGLYIGFPRLNQLRFIARDPILTGILKVGKLPVQSTFWRFVNALHRNVARQILNIMTALKRAGCKTIFKDQLSGATGVKRPALLRCVKKLEHGDTLMVWKLDRLGRSLRDLITMLDDLKKRGVKFRSLTEAIDTETPTGRAMWQMIGVLAELERSMIVERTRAGMKAARARGIHPGRKPSLSPEQIEHAQELRRKGKHPDEIAALLKCSRATIYRALAA